MDITLDAWNVEDDTTLDVKYNKNVWCVHIK